MPNKDKSKRILITGIAGFLGSHIARRCLDNGHKVWGVDNLVGGYKDNVPDGVSRLAYGDCCKLPLMNYMCEGVDVVYHCACTPYEGLSVFSPSLVYQNTAQATSVVLSAAIKNGVKRFIYCSSMARYGENKVPFTEDMKPAPVDPYGIAKVSSESLVRMLCSTHGLEWVIVVPHNIIGRGQKYDDPYRNVASIMANLMLQGRRPVIYGDGMQQRCFSHIDDVITCLEGILEHGTEEVINIGPDDEFVTIKYMARLLADIVGVDFHPIYKPARPCEVKKATCSAEKARKLLGYESKYNLEAGLRDIVEYIKGRGTRQFVYHLPLEIENGATPETWKDRLF